MPPLPASETSTPPPASWVTSDVKKVLFVQTVFGFAWSLYLLVPKFLTTSLQAGPDDIGRITAVGGLAGLLAIPGVGYALDHLGRLPVFRAGLLLVVVLSLGFTQVHNLGAGLYVLQACVTCAFVLSYNAGAALIADYAPHQYLGQALGWLGGATVFMNAVAVLVAEPLATHYGWTAVFWFGALAAAAGLAASWTLREVPIPTDDTQGSPVGAQGATRPVPWSLLVRPIGAALLVGCAFIAFFGFLQPYALERGATEVRSFFLGYSVAVLVGRTVLGNLGDRLGRRRVSCWALAGYALAALATQDLHPQALALYGALLGTAHGVLYPTLNALCIEHMPAKRRGLGMVLYNGAFNLGASIGSFGLGLLAVQAGYPTLYRASAAFALMAVAVLTLGRKERRSLPPS